ncbi:hypothetical protein LWI28_005691 [Acer negundo]|uniref:Pseudouridine synthase RsuA/RluA-like domain-containing protein n=1 Tax=Acer negundo TaxID=4023 RepID=A0AAD5JFY3_ACENE|nr:hypothetical protein LWI28_005691 [Acer negundo]
MITGIPSLSVINQFGMIDRKFHSLKVGGTSDNIEESCATFATRALELTDPLYTTHQIDNCTEGCVVLARTKEYCSVFHGKIRIRAQLAACGAPIVGDSMYMPAAIAEMSSPGLDPYGNRKKQYAAEDDKEMAIAEWISQHGKEPSVAVGLQACQISWDDGEHFYEAGSPWWRCKKV